MTKYLRLTLQVTAVVVVILMAEIFDYSGRSRKEEQLNLLRRTLVNGSDSFWDVVPAAWESGESGGQPVLTFQERRNEYVALGYKCVEVHRGYEGELFEAGIIPVCSNESQEVVAARYESASPKTP